MKYLSLSRNPIKSNEKLKYEYDDTDIFENVTTPEGVDLITNR